MKWAPLLLTTAVLLVGCSSGLPESQVEPTQQQDSPPAERIGSFDLVSAQDRSRVTWTARVGGQEHLGALTQVVGGLYLSEEGLNGASGVISANLQYVETGVPLWDQQISESFFEVLIPGKEKAHAHLLNLRLEESGVGDGVRRGEASVQIMFARGTVSLQLPVHASRSAAGWLLQSQEPASLDLGALGYGERLSALATALGVGAIEHVVRFEFEVYVEPMRPDQAPPAGPIVETVVHDASSPEPISVSTPLEETAASSDRCPDGMRLISGGSFELGESNKTLVAAYAPDRVLPRSRFQLVDYCVALHPFPGRAGLPWPRDGLGVDELPTIESVLHHHGRRLCTAAELTLAAAGPENRRYPWHATDRRQEDCEQDDVRPSSLGSRPTCRSASGLWDLQVRSSWIRMDAAARRVLTRPTDETSPGHDSTYWLWGANARNDTYYAPSNFGLHHHLAGSKAYQDDALRVCADPGDVSEEQRLAWDALIERYREQGSFQVLRQAAD